MWVLTTENELVNIGEARKIAVQIEPSDKPYTVVLLAQYPDGATVVLARAHQRDERYARSMAGACLRAIDEALRDGEHFCDQSDTCCEVVYSEEEATMR